MKLHPFQTKHGIKPLPLYFSLLTIVSIICGIFLLKIPADQKNAILLGLSFERLLLLFFFLIISLIALFLTIRLSRRSDRSDIWHRWINKHRVLIQRSSASLAVVFGLLLLCPDYRFAEFAMVYQRLRPVVFLVFWAAFSALVIFFLLSRDNIRTSISTYLRTLFGKSFLVFFLIFIAIALFIRLSGWGITAGNEAWYENAIPIQFHQVVLMIILGYLGSGIVRKIQWGSFFRSRTVHFLSIWILAALIWSLAPMKPHFFAPGPYPPNFEFYPYSDALHNDIAAQTALYGFGFNNGGIVLKPIVTFVIYLCHLLTGNAMNASLYLQSALFGVLPAILYLIASDIAGGFCGFLAAGLMILQEWNALNTTEILTVHSRLEMSEFLSQVLFASFALFILRWFRNGKNQIVFAAAAGGMLGLLIYTRFNFLAMLPAVILYSGFVFMKHKRQALSGILIFIVSFGICTAPWLIRSYQITGTFSPEIWGSFKAVIVDQRLKPILQPTTSPEESTSIITTDNSTEPAAGVALVQPTAELAEGMQPTEIPEEIQSATEVEGAGLRISVHPLIDTIGNHFLHNLSAMLFMLPVQVQLEDLEHLYSAEDSVWRQRWNGNLTGAQVLMVVINMAVLSVGLAAIWNTQRWAGLSFIFLGIVYAAALGLARTSGGRYLVPLNWVIIVLFSIGIGGVFRKIKPAIPSESEYTYAQHNIKGLNTRSKLILTIAGFCLVYCSILLIEKTSVPSIHPKSQEEAITEFKTVFPDIDWVQAEKQLSDGEMSLFQGNALYPRFYYFNQGEHGTDKAYVNKPYSRMVFRLLMSNNQTDVVLPLDVIPEIFPNHARVSVMGCLQNSDPYFQALAIIGEPDGKESFSYLRDPLQSFSCPVAEPVCTAVNECY